MFVKSACVAAAGGLLLSSDLTKMITNIFSKKSKMLYCIH